MKRFLFKLLKIFSVFNLLYLITIVLIGYIFYNLETFNIKKMILIIGDSHTEMGLNDSVVKNSINISQSADNYLYTYVKLKHILKKSQDIKVIVLSFSYHNIIKPINKWYIEDDEVAYKFPNYYYLLSVNELVDIFYYNRFQVIKSFYSIPSKKGKLLFKIHNNNLTFSQLELGSYWYKMGQNIDKDTINMVLKYKDSIQNISKIQLKYLLKIYDLCINNHIKLYLINTPLYYKESDKVKYFLNNYKSYYLPKAIYINFSDLKYDKDLFFNNDHLNGFGASIFSKKIDSLLNN